MKNINKLLLLIGTTIYGVKKKYGPYKLTKNSKYNVKKRIEKNTNHVIEENQINNNEDKLAFNKMKIRKIWERLKNNPKRLEKKNKNQRETYEKNQEFNKNQKQASKNQYHKVKENPKEFQKLIEKSNNSFKKIHGLGKSNLLELIEINIYDEAPYELAKKIFSMDKFLLINKFVLTLSNRRNHHFICICKKSSNGKKKEKMKILEYNNQNCKIIKNKIKKSINLEVEEEKFLKKELNYYYKYFKKKNSIKKSIPSEENYSLYFDESYNEFLHEFNSENLREN